MWPTYHVEVLALTYKIKSMDDVVALPCQLPQAARDELIRCTAILDYEYGTFRDDADGGYTLIAQTTDDLAEIKAHVDYDCHPPEWVSRFDSYLAAMYLLTNDFSITLFMPLSVAPQSILNELED